MGKSFEDKLITEVQTAHQNGFSMEKYHSRGQGSYLRNMVYGANDGIVTTFAVVAGVAGAGLSSSIILILGLANLLADGISMALGNYLGTRSENTFKEKERRMEEWEVKHVPEEEAKEIEAIYRKKGLSGSVLQSVVATITGDKKLWVDEMMIHELGIIPGQEESPWKNGAATFVAFVSAGFLPLVPYVFNFTIRDQFTTSIIMMALTLFFVGSLRSFFTKKNWFFAGLEMLGVGAIAAIAAYGVGYWINRLS